MVDAEIETIKLERQLEQDKRGLPVGSDVDHSQAISILARDQGYVGIIAYLLSSGNKGG